MTNKEKTLDIEKAEKQLHNTDKKKERKRASENKESPQVAVELNNPSSRSSNILPKTVKYIKKTNVWSERIQNAEQRLRISNSYQTLADLRDDDMYMLYKDYSQTK